MLPADPDAAIAEARRRAVSHERSRRLPLTLVLGALSIAAAAFGFAGGSPGRRATLVGLAVYMILYGALLLASRQVLTLSGINYDEQVAAFFRPFVLDSVVAFLLAAGAAVWLSRNDATASRFTAALRIAALLVALGLAYLAWAYGSAGLFSTWRLAPIPALFATFVAALQVVGVCVALLLVGLRTLTRRGA
jgi:hypothetical protein